MRNQHDPSLSAKVTSAAADGDGKGNRQCNPVSCVDTGVPAAKRSNQPESTPSNANGEAPSLSRKKSKLMVGKGQLKQETSVYSGESDSQDDISCFVSRNNVLADQDICTLSASQADRNAHRSGDASAAAVKGKDMFMEDKVHGTVLSVHCFGDVNINKGDGVEPANGVDPPTMVTDVEPIGGTQGSFMDIDIEPIGGAQGSCIIKHEHAFVADNCHDENMCMDKYIPLASQNCLRSEESALTQEMKLNIPSLAMEIKVPLDRRQKPAAPDILELNMCDVSEESMRYLQTFRPASDYVEEFSLIDEQQLTDVYHRLALSRIKDYKLLSTGEKLDIAEVAAQYPLNVLQTHSYFEHYENSLEWYFHQTYTGIAGLDDYQRLVLRDDDSYLYWDCYCNYCYTYERDQQYVQYCEEMMDKIKWIEDKVGVEEQLWWKYSTVAFHEAMKIAIKFPTLFRDSALFAYSEYKEIIVNHFKRCRDFDFLFLEIWKRVAKNNEDFYDALKEMYEKDMFPSRSYDIKRTIEKRCDGWMKRDYDTYVATIDKEVSEDDCLFLIREALKKIFPELKGYLHYVRKKMEIAERIGLAGYQKREDMASAEANAEIAN